MSASTFVLIAIIVAIVGLCWASASQSARKRERRRITQAAYAARFDAFKSSADALEQDIGADWAARHVRRNGLTREYLMMSADQRRLMTGRIARGEGGAAEYTEHVLELSKVVSAELQQESETILRLETTATTKKQGALGRAVVGGVLLGGAGAIVGAASAGSRTSAITKGTSRTRKGPVYLMIGTTDLGQPVLKVQMNSAADGEQWLHRIRGGLALLEGG